MHDNHVHHAGAHALDFDAYTSRSVCYNNLCEDNREEGIFVEETAHDNVIVANTCRRNGNGIGVYSNAVGPVANNFFIGNQLSANLAFGLTAGGYGHTANKHSEGNVFVANTGTGNVRGMNPMHGSVHGDYWIGNTDDAANGTWYTTPAASANVSMFEP